MDGIAEGIYRHYKGNVYRVLCTVTHTETLEELVVYEDVAFDAKQWARPLSLWNEPAIVDGVPVPRFQYLASSLDQMDSKPLFKLIEAMATHMETHDRMGEENDIAFYERLNGGVIIVSQRAMGLYEDGEDISEYPDEMVRDIVRICDQPAAFIRLPNGDDVNEYALMESFSCEVPYRYQGALQRAIQGKDAFCRFKDTTARFELLDDWYGYKTAAYRKEAREWCDFKKLPWGKELLDRREIISSEMR